MEGQDDVVVGKRKGTQARGWDMSQFGFGGWQWARAIGVNSETEERTRGLMERMVD